MNIQRYIEQVPFFNGLAPEHHAELTAICTLKHLNKKAYLFHEGEQGERMFLLVEGNLQLHKNSEEGREVVIRVVKPGEIFAEVVLFERECYPVSARAVTPVDVLAFPRSGIHRLLSQQQFRNDFISLLMNKQRYLTERIQELTTRDVEYRFFTFLRNQYGDQKIIHTPISKKDIAAAIGTTPESLSRLIQRLQDAQVIEWSGREIRMLQDPWTWLE